MKYRMIKEYGMANNVAIGVNDFKTYCLKSGNQHLLDEWDYSKNALMPTEYSHGSGKKVWWICPVCSNHYEATINHRKNGTGCPKCKYEKSQETKLHNRKSNKSTLGDLYPELIKEWCIEENGALSPFNISPNYKNHIWWKCEKGHKWRALPGNRIKPRGCPYCAGKKVIPGENDLASKHPELLVEWDYENNNILPTKISVGSGKRINWKCKTGHQWSATVGSRFRGSNCPYCGNKKIIVGENDLATTHPELVTEWNYEKNIIKPTEVVRGSEVYVWWRCSKGHEWKAKITNRVHGTNCPYCTLYMHTSFPEQALFYYIKQCFPDAINRDVSRGFELDIYIPSINVGIEYDGQRFHQNIKKDIKKIESCDLIGVKLIKIRERGCPELDDERCRIVLIESTYDRDIKVMIEEIGSVLDIPSMNVDIGRDRQKIYEKYMNEIKEESLLKRYPEIAKEWHPTKNGSLGANMVSIGTGKRIWWLCEKGHEYEVSVLTRVKGSGCPYCANKRVWVGYNDLKTTNPGLLALWHPVRNEGIAPDGIRIGTKKKIWWKGACGHEWKDYPSAVAKNRQPCPYCGNRILQSGVNDLKTKNPYLVEEWNWEKNSFAPDEVLAGTNKRVWWKCRKCGYEWQAFIQNRREGKRKNTGCPSCARVALNRRNSRKVQNMDTAEVFESVTMAAQRYGCTAGNIIQCCSGHTKTARGYHWRYID